MKDKLKVLCRTLHGGVEHYANGSQRTLYGSTFKSVERGLPGGAVVKGAVLQRQLCHQRLCRNRPRPGGPWGDAQMA